MDVTIREKEDGEIRVEIGGEDHTLLNVLKDALLQIEAVEAATYDMNPEQSGSMTDPVLYVKVAEGEPEDAIKDAIELVDDEASAFRDGFEDAIAA